MNEYPSWVCHDCAIEADGKYPDGHVSSWHMAVCPCCGETNPVTQPRDYRYPKLISKFKYEPKDPT